MATPNTPNAAASATTPATRTASTPAAATRTAPTPAAATRTAPTPAAATRTASTPAAATRPAAATSAAATPAAAARPAPTPAATPAAATPASATPAAATSAAATPAAASRPAPTPTGLPVTAPAMPATKSVQEVAKAVQDRRITEISSKSEFESTIADAGNKLVIVEFYATWCGPCKIISTKLEELAGKYEAQAMVIKLDVDECEEVAVEYNVTSMPTFVFFRNKQKISQLVGSSGEKLVENIEKLCNENKASEPTASVDTTTPSIPNPAVK